MDTFGGWRACVAPSSCMTACVWITSWVSKTTLVFPRARRVRDGRCPTLRASTSSGARRGIWSCRLSRRPPALPAAVRAHWSLRAASPVWTFSSSPITIPPESAPSGQILYIPTHDTSTLTGFVGRAFCSDGDKQGAKYLAGKNPRVRSEAPRAWL